MSGIIGHTMYGVLALRESRARGLPIVPLLERHEPSYLCGAYLGSDIVTMPEAVCVDTGEEVGYATVPLDRSPITGGAVRPWMFRFGDREYRPREIFDRFYGRAHLVFGWAHADRQHTVPWDHLADYVALTIQDSLTSHPAGDEAGDRPVAYLFGWLVHIVGDSLIKSVRPGLRLTLLDGTYTPANRPVQDLVTFHEIGRKQLGLDWKATLAALAATPVEPVQLHALRLARPRGRLAQCFPNAWSPEDEPLALAVFAENRRYLVPYLARLVPDYDLTDGPDGPQCRPAMSRLAHGLTYPEMVAAAKQADFEGALRQIATTTVDLFEEVLDRVPRLQRRS
jgi:hypothetical protein